MTHPSQPAVGHEKIETNNFLMIVLIVGRLWYSPLAPLEIRPSLLAGSTFVVAIICLAASMLPFMRIRRIDPAVVLQG